MGKVNVDAAIFGGSSVKKVPLFHKIDMYGSYALLTLIWILILINTTMSIGQYTVTVPKEMFVHGPLAINFSLPDSEKRLICNPYFNKFVSNSTFFLDAFGEDVLTTAKSPAFLALPEIVDTMSVFSNVSGRNVTYMGLHPNEVCELIPPNLLAGGGCMTYKDLQTNCLKDVCETSDGVNLCWWKQASLFYMLIVLYTIIFVPALLLVVVLMFDPPPSNMRLIARPILCSICFFGTGILGIVAVVISSSNASKYLNQPALYADYPQYTYSAGSGYWCVHVVAESSVAFGIVYGYIHFFTPKYPRHEARQLIRQRHFDHELKKLETKYHIEESTN